jgi:polar amino acid transport system substrate-binding protein
MGMDVEIRLGTYRERIKALAAGEIDAMEGFSYSDERAKLFDFSPAHTIINLAIFGRKDSPSISELEKLRGKQIIVMTGGRMEGLLKEHGLADNLIHTETYANGLRLLASGEYDYMFMGSVPGMYLIKEYKLTNIVVIIKEVDQQKYCFAVKKGNRELLARFSEGLAIVKKTGQYDDLYDKWFGVLEPRGAPWSKVIKIGSIIGTFFFIVLCIIFVWSRTLKKQVGQRTAALAFEIKERRRAEEELRRNQEQLLQASKMAAIGTLVSGVAHEINNPNGLILLNSKMLVDMYEDLRQMTEERYRKEGDFDVGKWRYAEVRENLGQMLTETVDASKRIGRIVEDLRNFSRRDTSDLNEAIDVNNVVRSAIRLLDNSIKKSTDSLIVRYADDLPKIKGNAQRIEQVVVNLLLNACQSLLDRTRGVTLTTQHKTNEQMVLLEIADSGIGIAPDKLQYIADPFYTTKREQGGTGLGLSVSTTIIKEHGGLLTFKSAPGKGTVATLLLPIAKNGGQS